MENIRIRRMWNQASTLRLDNLLGTVFTGENQAHTFEITGVNGQTPVPLTGTITGKAVLGNGATELLTGSLEDGKALVTLSEACYTVEGRINVAIFMTNEGTTICIYCGVGSVYPTTTGRVIYPSAAIQDIQELIDDLRDLIGDIPLDYSALNQEVSDLKINFALQQENIPDTVQTIAFDSDGNIQSITHMRGNVAVRTDAFTFADTAITEVRTLNTGEKLTIVTNTDTLQTTVTYAAA